MISIIIPVFHETHIINQSLMHLQNPHWENNTEIIVVDGSPKGDTVKAVDSIPVTKIISPKGRGIQMNAGAAAARGNILLFLHADTRLPEKGREEIIKVMGQKKFAAGAFELGIDSDRRIYRIIEKTVCLRSRITRIPYGDQALFIKKSIFSAMGGFRNIPIMEDAELMQRLKKKKLRICILPEKVMTSARRWEKEGLIYGILRNRILMALFTLGYRPEKMIPFYRNHS